MLKGKNFIRVYIFFPKLLWKEWQNNIKTFSIIKKMKKLYCVICSKYGKSEKPKIPYLLEKTLVLSIICKKCKNEDEKVLKEQ